MKCSSSVGLIIRCNITPRHSSKVSSEDKLSVVILIYGDMVGCTGDASPVSPAVAIRPGSPYTRSTQPCIPPGSLNRVSASAGVKAGMSPLPGGR